MFYFIRKNKQAILLAVCIAIINLPNLYYAFSGLESTVNLLVKKLVFIILAGCISLFPMLFVRPKYYTRFLFCLLPFVIGSIASLYYVHSMLSVNMIITVLNTNLSEASELLKSSIQFVLIISVILFLYLYAFRNILTHFTLNSRVKILYVLFSLLVFFVLFAYNFRVASNFKNKFTERLGLAYVYQKSLVSKTFPVNIVFLCNNIYTELSLKKQYQKSIDRFSYDISENKHYCVPEIVILVIGESSRFNQWGINGYSINTSPLLQATKNLISFEKCFAPANLTEQSVPLLLTIATPDKKNLKYKVKSIVSSFADLNFSTYWISNQAYATSSILNLYKDEASYIRINSRKGSAECNFDSFVLQQLFQNNDSLKNGKHFIILHTLGSHFRYNQRYPQEFNVFKPSIENNIDLSNILLCKSKLINSYNNTILYSDYVLSEIIKQLKGLDRSSIMIYVSDHGENLGENNHILHGENIPSYYELHVPLFIWYSDKYKEGHEEIVEVLKNNKTKFFPTYNLPKLIWDLSSVNSPLCNVKSLASDDYYEPDYIYVLGSKKYKYSKEELCNYLQ